MSSEILSETQKKQNSKTLYFYGLIENQLDPFLVKLKKKYPSLDFGVYPREGRMLVVVSSLKKRNSLNAAFLALKAQFSSLILDFKGGKIEEAIHDLFIKKKLKLSMAESCTGGHISAKLTALPNASYYFLGSIICYSNFMKKKFLSVDEKLLKEKGAVSKECVEKMALSLLDVTASDYSIAVSGIAGPKGGTLKKPVGTIFLGIGIKGKSQAITVEFHLHGSRQQIIELASNRILFELYKMASNTNSQN